jgi:hypothetical protein
MTDTRTPESLSMLTTLQIGELLRDICRELVRRTPAEPPPAGDGMAIPPLGTRSHDEAGGQLRTLTL